jgi:hypothetical protein
VSKRFLYPIKNQTFNERIPMSPEENRPRTLREMEVEVEAEGREWMRRRLEEKVQAEADRHGGVFPPKRAQGVASSAAKDASADGLRADRTGGVARPKSSG